MKLRGYSFLLFVMLLCFQVVTVEGQASFDMNNLGKVWQEFITAPGPDTALKVYQMLPAAREDNPPQLAPQLRQLIMDKMNVLESRIYAGDRNALQVAFRLLVISDGEMEKSLLKIIGYLLRFNTRLFLEELRKHEALVSDLDSLVCSFRLNAPGDKAELNLERNIRLKALEYVQDKKLKAIKKKCIKILKKFTVE